VVSPQVQVQFQIQVIGSDEAGDVVGAADTGAGALVLGAVVGAGAVGAAGVAGAGVAGGVEAGAEGWEPS